MRAVSLVVSILLLPLVLIAGCGTSQTADFVQIEHTSYNPSQHQLTIRATPAHGSKTGENFLDIHDPLAISNFSAYAAPGETVNTVVVRGVGQPQQIKVPGLDSQANQAAPPDLGALVTRGVYIPGVRMDHSIRPRAGLGASYHTKQRAVIAEARSKLGTPYIWGHNEDRGQYGFDCSNYTAYVYHHALGYRMSGASKVQYYRVGRRIAPKYKRVGDLVIFEKGKHVGIYAGNNWVIQEGGGLGKVGYVSIKPTAYWGKRISVVKRMF